MTKSKDRASDAVQQPAQGLALNDDLGPLPKHRVGCVVRAVASTLTVTTAVWRYAQEHQAAIAAYWAEQKVVTPTYFNGPVWLLSDWRVDQSAVFHATFLRSDFKSYLYWRSRQFEAAGVWDAFGSGLVRACDGAILLGQQSSGNVNAGLSYPPSGFIDHHDVAEGGAVIDIERSIAREIHEETGLLVGDLERLPGFWLTFDGAQISIACLFDSPLPSQALQRQVSEVLAAQKQPELASVHLVRSQADLAHLKVPPYAQRLLTSMFAVNSDTS